MLNRIFAASIPANAAALPFLGSRHTSESGAVAGTLRGTWQSPSDTRTILLVIGGDVIARALAQLTGPRLVPVAFSFGWVAYAFATLANVFGDGRLLPPPDYGVKLFNPASGSSRDNRSWVLGRVVRDMEGPLEPNFGINLAIHVVTSGDPPSLDVCYYSGFAVILGQLLAASIPCIVSHDWSVLLLTGSGIVLCLLTGSLPQWNSEKYQARRVKSEGKGKGKVVALTAGNGSRNVFVIIDPGLGLDLEDLAGAQSPLHRQRVEGGNQIISMPATSLWGTQIACTTLAFLWMAFLITWTGVNTDPWFFILIGGSGMLQNLFVAGVKRKPSASGIHVKLVESIPRREVMHGLMDAERDYPGLGQVLLPEFFSTEGLAENEKLWWKGDRAPYDKSRPQDSFVNRSDTAADVRKARQEYAKIVETPKEVPSLRLAPPSSPSTPPNPSHFDPQRNVAAAVSSPNAQVSLPP
ncbi:hypothetical protein K438DRAFT_128001 [Mycena galopus ATCC 62051]|nr:hypothetical protein K438DRAFT_128001 [Mycena galopus ATCC 62051]